VSAFRESSRAIVERHDLHLGTLPSGRVSWQTGLISFIFALTFLITCRDSLEPHHHDAPYHFGAFFIQAPRRVSGPSTTVPMSLMYNGTFSFILTTAYSRSLIERMKRGPNGVFGSVHLDRACAHVLFEFGPHQKSWQCDLMTLIASGLMSIWYSLTYLH